MTKLLTANFMRLFKSTLFRISLIIMTVLAIIQNASRAADIKANPDYYAELRDYCCADCFLYAGAVYLIIILAVFAGVFFGSDYSDGTIRNKLAIGHSRLNVYAANFTVLSFAAVALMFVYTVACFGSGMIFLEPPSEPLGKLLLGLLVQIGALIAFCSVLVFVTMLIRSKVGSSITVILTAGAMFFAALTINDMLSAPEFIEKYSISSVDPDNGDTKHESITEENPNYLRGTKRTVCETLNKMLPVNQLYLVTSNNFDDLGIMFAYAIIWIAVTNFAGIILFR